MPPAKVVISCVTLSCAMSDTTSHHDFIRLENAENDGREGCLEAVIDSTLAPSNLFSAAAHCEPDPRRRRTLDR
jgi:hypothetical protein